MRPAPGHATAHAGEALPDSSRDGRGAEELPARRRTDRLLLEQERMLALMARGCALAECLEALTQAISRLHPNTRAAVLMANEARTRIDHTYASALSSAFGEGMRGLPIDDRPIAVSCTAIHRGEPVTCADVAADEHWSMDWRGVYNAESVRAAYATPVLGADGKAIAAFTLCFEEPHEPDAWERGLGQFGAHIATIAIERERTLQALRAKGSQLEAELTSARLLQELSSQLVRKQDMESLYAQILNCATVIMRADFASMQRLYPQRSGSRALRLISHRGFSPEAVRAWEWVDGDAISSCGAALRAGTRAVVTDIESCDFLAGTEGLETYRNAGIRAMQSTPLISRAGETLGMISTHWSTPHQPSDGDLRLFDILARQTADLIERNRAEDSLRGQQRILEMVATSAPLLDTLNELMRLLETQEPGARFGILIVTDDGQHFRRGSGPSLPELYHETLVGVPIAPPYLGSCGEAAHRGESVVVLDVRSDTRYAAEWRELMLSCGFLAGSWTPVCGSNGRALASLAIYYDHPCDPTPANPQLIETGTQLAAIAIERAQAEAAQIRSRQVLEAADRQKDEFLAMLAHELRNPLAPIGNASEVLSRIVGEDARAQLAVGMIKRQTAQLTRLVDDLLDVSRITQGRIQLRRRPIDLAHVIAQAVETVEPQLREKQHKISVTTSGSQPLYVHGDSVRLVQSIGNVLANAVKYTDPGGEIWVCTHVENESVVIEIADTGAGITPDLLPRVFDLFVQSDRTLDRAQGGLGIGLAVVKRLIEMHGGQVVARSGGLGTGSTFEIRLPRIARPQAFGTDQMPVKAPHRRVLVVDDNRDAADSLALLLSCRGDEVEAVYSGKEALERIESFRPDVALLDIGLPEMTGYELAERLRAMSPLNGIRLVALTGYGQAEDYQRTRAAGFDDHLVKPVDLSALERTLAGISGGGDRERG